mgnify:CR=1 FL=1
MFNPITLEGVETTFLNFAWREHLGEVLSVLDKSNLSGRVVILSTSASVIKSWALSKEEESKTFTTVNVSWRSKLSVSVVVVRPLPEVLSVLACLLVFREWISRHVLLFLTMQGLEVVYSFFQSIVVANNTSWVIVSKINVNKFAIADSGSDTKGVTCSLLSKIVGWLERFAVKLGNSSSLMIKAIRRDYHSSCDMDTDAGSIELEGASL